MITYFYWGTILIAALVVLIGLIKINKGKLSLICAFSILFFGWGAYYFHFEQLFVKRLGGVMSITTPSEHMHLGTTWKDDNLWIETYDHANNTCYFKEYSKGNMLQGQVKINNCNPFRP